MEAVGLVVAERTIKTDEDRRVHFVGTDVDDERMRLLVLRIVGR